MSEKVYFYNYDYKTNKHSLMCRPATIDGEGAVHIEFVEKNGHSSILKRPAGEWLSENMVKCDMLRCIHEKLKEEVRKEMEQEDVKDGQSPDVTE